MSISILNRGGASGGLKPELTVISSAGDIIDIMQNGIIVYTYIIGANETQHTFVVKLGTYTVKGTRAGATATTSVVIDAVTQYSVTLKYIKYLYKEGDLCTAVTGGWSKTPTVTGNSNSSKAKNTVSFNAGEILVNCYGGWSETNGVQTVNAVSMSGYDTICFDMKLDKTVKVDGTYYTWTSYGAWDGRFNGAYGKNPGGKSVYLGDLSTNIAGVRQTFKCALDGMASSYPGVLYGNYGGTDAYFPCHVYNVWLE